MSSDSKDLSRYLTKHLEKDVMERVLAQKQGFVSFLAGLHNMQLKDYFLLTDYVTDEEAFFYLFSEWFMGNPMFNLVEASYCPLLKDSKFYKLILMMRHDFELHKYLAPYLIVTFALK